MMIIENDFNIGQTVYLITDKEFLPRFVTGITIRVKDIIYELSSGTSCSNHYSFEITEIDCSIMKS